MKRGLLLSALVGLPLSAAEVKLAWNPSPSTNVTGYFLYVGTNQPATNIHAVKVNTGTNLTATVDLKAGRYVFWATAHDDLQIESEPSNTVLAEVPEPPQNMRTVIIEATMDLTGTNWFQMGFLRLRLPVP